MATNVKISQMTPVASLANTDLFEIAEDEGGGIFSTKSVSKHFSEWILRNYRKFHI